MVQQCQYVYCRYTSTAFMKLSMKLKSHRNRYAIEKLYGGDGYHYRHLCGDQARSQKFFSGGGRGRPKDGTRKVPRLQAIQAVLQAA